MDRWSFQQWRCLCCNEINNGFLRYCASCFAETIVRTPLAQYEDLTLYLSRDKLLNNSGSQTVDVYGCGAQFGRLVEEFIPHEIDKWACILFRPSKGITISITNLKTKRMLSKSKIKMEFEEIPYFSFAKHGHVFVLTANLNSHPSRLIWYNANTTQACYISLDQFQFELPPRKPTVDFDLPFGKIYIRFNEDRRLEFNVRSRVIAECTKYRDHVEFPEGWFIATKLGTTLLFNIYGRSVFYGPMSLICCRVYDQDEYVSVPIPPFNDHYRIKSLIQNVYQSGEEILIIASSSRGWEILGCNLNDIVHRTESMNKYYSVYWEQKFRVAQPENCELLAC